MVCVWSCGVCVGAAAVSCCFIFPALFYVLVIVCLCISTPVSKCAGKRTLYSEGQVS